MQDRAVYRNGLVVGILLMVTAAVIVMADTDRMSDKMPTQVVPRRLAWYPGSAGLILFSLSAVGLAFT